MLTHGIGEIVDGYLSADPFRMDKWKLDAVGNWSGLPAVGDIADDFGFTAAEGGGPDGVVDYGDFAALLGLLGPCPDGPGCPGDIADEWGLLDTEGGGPDGMVDMGDFTALLGLIGQIDSGRFTSGNLDGYGTPWHRPGTTPTVDADSVHQYQRVDLRNRITGMLERDFEHTGIIYGGTRRTLTAYDKAGNLVFDGKYAFFYDAWNRLLLIHEAEVDHEEFAPATDTFDPDEHLIFGDLLRRYTYDGFGRLVRTESPATTPSAFYTEEYFYDGVRRIQEIVTDPDATGQPKLAREYVWGPGDSGFDELLVQFDGDSWLQRSKDWWSFHDTSGDMVALCDIDGSAARVVAQWSYEPYGDVVAAEHLHSFPVQKVGHKGLFVDRLDAAITGHRIVPFGHVVYHNRNRVYVPALGRFLQQDPNQTAMSLLEGGYHGSVMGASSLAYSLEELYGDGHNLYQYLGTSPLQRFDTMGLSWTENYDGVLLPVINAVSGLVAGNLLEILQGYTIMAQVHSFLQGAAYDQEEHLDWAMDWSRSDNDNPFFSSSGGFAESVMGHSSPDPAVSDPATAMFAAAMPKKGKLNTIRMRGVPAEQASHTANNTVAVKRYVTDESIPKGDKRQRTRMYDGEDAANPGNYMEVKAGYQTLNTRVRRQIDFDRRAVQDPKIPTKGVKWEFHLGPRNKEPSEPLLQYLRDSNIPYTIVRTQ